MKPTLISLLSLLLFSTIQAQYEFEPGYFIDNQGIKTECLIKNMVWKNNPSQFDFKLNQASEIKKAAIANIQEFGIDGLAKYEKHKVLIDTHNKNSKSNPDDIQFNYQEKELFLKVLEEGTATLYEYQTVGYKRYLFKIDDGQVEQLAKKSFTRKNELKGTKLEYVRTYKLQLYEILVCETIALNDVAKVSFKKHALTNLFRNYNYCKDDTSTSYNNAKIAKRRNILNTRVRIGLGLTNFSGVFDFGREVEVFKNAISNRAGIEFEYVPKMLSGLISVTLEPGFFYFSKNNSDLLNRGAGKINFRAIQMPIGLRYNYKISKRDRLYFTVLNGFEYQVGSLIQFDNGPITPSIDDKLKNILFSNFALGIGLNYNKINLEVRHHFYKNSNTLSTNSVKYNTTDLILGYQF